MSPPARDDELVRPGRGADGPRTVQASAGPGAADPAATGEPPVPVAQGDVVFYATLAALTTFIPLPFLDDFLEQQVRLRMIQRLMQVHEVPPDDDRAGRAARRSARARLFRLSRKAVLVPMRRVLRRVLLKTFLVLDVKLAVDTFGAVYHQGYLFDFALSQGWLEAASPERVRDAVERVCDRAGTSPVNHAAARVFRESGQMLRAAVRAVADLALSRSRKEEALLERIEEEPAAVRGLSARLQSALTLVPPAYFRDLRRDLAEELFPRGDRNGPG